MKSVYRLIVAAAIGSIVAVSAQPALACDMARGGNTSATSEQSQRLEDLRAKLKANGAAIAASQDQAQLLDLLKERTELQDALLAEVMGTPDRRAESRRSTHQH